MLTVLCCQSLYAQSLKQELPLSLHVEVKNPLKQQRENVMVYIPEADILKLNSAFNTNAFVVLDGKTEVPGQYNRKDQKGIVLVLDQLKANEARKLTIRFKKDGTVERQYPKRTQAELSHKVGGEFQNRKYIGGEFQNVDSLRVPDEHTDHSYFIRYEGPGWESDKVGYRFYLDWRNGTDVFGKKTKDMVLQQVGQDGFDSYHEEAAWGMDVLKVGKSLGVGTLAHFSEGRANRVAETDSMISVIAENGNVYSSILTNYYGWKVAGMQMDLRSLISIHAGTRLTHHEVQVEGASPQNLSTGLNKDSKAILYTSKGSDNQWGFLASYGEQSLNNDKLGIAVLFRPQDFLEFTEDKNSHVVKLKSTAGKLEYYYLAAWELEPEGIKNEEQFVQYLRKTAHELANPVQVKLTAGNRL
ncbi:DUF4861 domain-containing protein [Pontibacter korlensis]|nr:DUF4861 domain-containing protein [Pontibacter korlensis]